MSTIEEMPPISDGSKEISLSPTAVATLRATPTDEEIESAEAAARALGESTDLAYIQAESAAVLATVTELSERIRATRAVALKIAEAWDGKPAQSSDEMLLELGEEFGRYADMAGNQLQRMKERGFDDAHAQHAAMQVHGAMLSISLGG